jgi:hypothetical protein
MSQESNDQQLQETLEQFSQDLKSNTSQFLALFDEIVPVIHQLLESENVENTIKDSQEKVIEKYNSIKAKKKNLEEREVAMSKFLRFVSEYLGQREDE